MKEYWNNEKATFETLENGWLRTGDLVKKDKDEYFYVVGRKKEMFISGGENVYPIEIERVLQSHPSIAEAAVVGIQDDRWGEVGHAIISVRESLSLDDVKAYCRKQLAGFKVPKYFSVLDQLPKGDSGKINKKLLKNLKVGVQSQFLESNH
jgi:fatty-acyl-CoA synthase